MATNQQKILFTAAFARSMAETNINAMAANLYGKDTDEVRDNLTAISYYAESIIETSLKHGVKPVHVHELTADRAGDVLIIAATGKAETEVKAGRVSFEAFADLLKATADKMGAYFRLSRELESQSKRYAMAATFAEIGNPRNVLGMVYFDVLIAPKETTITAIETAIKGI